MKMTGCSSFQSIKVGLLLLIVLATCSVSRSYGDERDGVASEEALALMDGFAANWAGLDRFDALMKVESFRVLPSGVGQDDTACYRFMCDFRNNKYLFVKLVEREETQFRDGSVARRGFTVAFFHDEKSRETWIREVPKPARKLGSQPAKATLSTSRFPDIRLIGCYGMTRDFDHRFSLDEVFQAEFHAGKRIQELRKSDDFSTVAVDDPYSGGRLRRNYKFDLNRIVPVSMTYAYGTDEKEVIRRREEYKWTQESQVYVPSEVHCEKMVSIVHQGKKVSITEQMDASIRWFSVNQPLDDEVMRPQTLRDDELLYKLMNEPAKKGQETTSDSSQRPRIGLSGTRGGMGRLDR